MTDAVEALRETWTVRPVKDPEAWAERLVDAGLLAEQQARVIAHKHGTDSTDAEVAETLGLSPGTVGDYRREAEKKLRAADETLRIIGELRREVRPDPEDDPRT